MDIDFLAVKWLWLYAGVVLMLMELFVPGLVLLFFGLGACTVGALKFVFPDMGVSMQLLIFSVSSIVYLLGLRRYFVKSLNMREDKSVQADLDDPCVGKRAQVTETVRADVPGRVMLGDAEWNAVADGEIAPGATVQVISRNNLTLKVKEI